MKIRYNLQYPALAVALLFIPAVASAQSVVNGGAGVNLQSTGQISNGPTITFPSQTNGSVLWTNKLLSGYVPPAANFTGVNADGSAVPYLDLIPIKTSSVTVVDSSGNEQALLNNTGVTAATLFLYDPTPSGHDDTITMNNGIMYINGVAAGSQRLTLSGQSLSITRDDGTTVVDTVTLPSAGSTGNAQTLAVSGETLTISGTGGNSVTLPTQTLGVSGQTLTISNGNAVALPTQTLGITGQTLSISNGNTVTLPAAGSAGNAQTLSISGSTLTISGAGGNSVTLPTSTPQNLTLSGLNLGITGGGTGVTLPTPTLSLSGTVLTVTTGGASTTQDLSSIDTNIYNSNGTLTGARTVTQGANSLTFAGTGGVALSSGNVTVTAGDVGIGVTTPIYPLQFPNPPSRSLTANPSIVFDEAAANNYQVASIGSGLGTTMYFSAPGTATGAGFDFVAATSASAFATVVAIPANGTGIFIYPPVTEGTNPLVIGAGTGSSGSPATLANGNSWTGGLFAEEFFGNSGSIGNETHLFGGAIAPMADNLATNGTSTNRWTAVYAVNGTIQTSDVRLKTHIEDSSYGLGAVMKLRPVTYNWKTDPDKNRMSGFIAQEVESLVPEAVVKPQNDKEYYGMKYEALLPVLTKAIQEQQQHITEQDHRIAALEQEKAKFALEIKSMKGQAAEITQIKAALEEMRKLVVDKSAAVSGSHTAQN